MENVKQYVIDYLEGRVKSREFVEKLEEDPSIIAWLQSVVPEGKTMFKYKFDQFYRMIGKEEVPYSVASIVEEFLTQKNVPQLGKENNIHSYVEHFIKGVFPDEDIQVDDSLDKMRLFLLEACPEYLDSTDVENSGILEKLMEEFPESMPKTKRIKAFRAKLKEMFYVEGQKYPRWIQSSEWPISKTGKPTKFLRQKSVHKGEVTYYYFLDVDAGEEIEIMQAF